MSRAINAKSVFSGEYSVLDYMNPDNLPYTPLVEICPHLNPYRNHKVRIFAKLLNQLPAGNVKMLASFNMLQKAKAENKLEGVSNIVEYSSGNTILSATLIARLMGISNSVTIISHEAFWSRIQLMRFLGIKTLVHDEPVNPKKHDPKSGIYKAKKMGRKKGWFCLEQYNNGGNPDAHQLWTGPEIWDQTEGKISIFCSAIGTGGTVVGTSKFLKKMNPKLTIVGVSRVGGPVPGVRSTQRLNLLEFDWTSAVDDLVEIDLKESYEESLNLSRHGLLVGPSSGFAFAGLKKYLSKKLDTALIQRPLSQSSDRAMGRPTPGLDLMRNTNGEILCVFPCYDSPFQYLGEYFKFLDPKLFPPVENKELLKHAPNR
jgi:cysteine synthase